MNTNFPVYQILNFKSNSEELEIVPYNIENFKPIVLTSEEYSIKNNDTQNVDVKINKNESDTSVQDTNFEQALPETSNEEINNYEIDENNQIKISDTQQVNIENKNTYIFINKKNLKQIESYLTEIEPDIIKKFKKCIKKLPKKLRNLWIIKDNYEEKSVNVNNLSIEFEVF